MGVITPWLPVLGAVALLAAIVVVVMRLANLRDLHAPVIAIVRCAAQLAAISLILTGIIASPWFVALALAVMFAVAATTATRRLGFTWTRLAQVAGAMVAGVAVVLTVFFTTGALEASPRYFLAAGGIIIGNSMSIATLAGRRFYADMHDGWAEVEGWLALGARPREASATTRRRAAFEALVPSIDQTKTTGLVTLPGAFVGAMLGGASPAEAGRFQVLVLSGVLAAGVITGVLLLWALAPVARKPAKL